jgi:hypothetical protein
MDPKYLIKCVGRVVFSVFLGALSGGIIGAFFFDLSSGLIIGIFLGLFLKFIMDLMLLWHKEEHDF